MEADISLIRRLAHGAVGIVEDDGVFQFHRFTEAQRAVYTDNHDFWRKTFGTSGIRLEFVTDATRVAVAGCAEPASSRNFYDFDVAVNGVLVMHQSYDSCIETPEFAFDIELDGRMNRVALYLPCLTRIGLKKFAFAGESRIAPVEKKRRMLCFGDSITQGYDTRHPSLAYPNQLADALDAEMVNKGVGGDKFNPALAILPDAEIPDLITVAYGTNDWSVRERKELEDSATAFFDTLARLYPDTPVCAMLPIWRRDLDRITKVGTFADAAKIIRNAASRHPRATVVDGLGLLPHLPECCVADGLHPNDFGFLMMTRNLLRKLPEL